MRKAIQHPPAQIFRQWVLFCWFSCTWQLLAVRCLHFWAQGQTRWQLLHCLPSDPDNFLSLQLWRGAIDDLVSHSLRLRSLLGLITYVEAVPEEAGKW